MTAKKTPLYILLTYLFMQLSSGLIAKLITAILKTIDPEADKIKLFHLTYGWATFTTFLLGFLVTLFFVVRDKDFFKKGFTKGKKATLTSAILWGVLGFVLVLVTQLIAGKIEELMGVSVASQNTASLSAIAAISPLIIVSLVFFGPFLEEVVFRRIIFGSLNQTTNFFVAALVSAIMFGIIHMEFSHLLTYISTGLVFAFLYNKTQRIITPMIAHMMLNAFVLYIQLNQLQIMDFIDVVKKFFGL